MRHIFSLREFKEFAEDACSNAAEVSLHRVYVDFRSCYMVVVSVVFSCKLHPFTRKFYPGFLINR